MTETSAPNLPRLLIFVVAYRAESTLRQVLERIPAAVFDTCDTEILVVDDASEDRTFAIGREVQRERPEIRMTVLRNEYNQGYGGNQKVGYTDAIRRGFDFVAMVHGDGQYAPEELPKLLEPLLAGTTDAVFGSRMMIRGAARRGGMPLYKRIGNRVLSVCQNALLGTRLSEFHSGYRVYSVRALERIPFTLNSNDFHFDTQIILQLLNARQRITELPIPTYYGDEISHVDGLRYAANVMLWTLRNVAHHSGVLYQRALDTELHQEARYDLKLGFPSSHTYAIAAVPPGATVLDLGSGPGAVARELEAKGCRVTVVDRRPPPAGSEPLDHRVRDLDEPLDLSVEPYQYILLLDILEHLRDPELFLERLRRQFDHRPKNVILTTPNVAFVVQRLMLLAGQFNYGKKGILDRTHTRLYTYRSLRRLLRECGFRVHRVQGVPAPFPLVFGHGGLSRALLALNRGLIAVSKSLFSYQIYVEMTTTPTVDYVLDHARGEPESGAG